MTTCLAQLWQTQVFPLFGDCDHLSASTGNHLPPGESLSASHLVPVAFPDASARLLAPFWELPLVLCYGCFWQALACPAQKRFLSEQINRRVAARLKMSKHDRKERTF
ncbi:hypothetical protein A4R35_10445 [Thermogemmatispora tikiterensis]|uniref:Uncharacterized protein n=1 Tax=Thermogemmatispora tikiterensis TaxID=1825093 RepID=A0A328VLF6_9CHLR|nr:hypothetical protein A4R35_10445 [Thermogemmatispora tikiterensis]